MKKNYPPPNAQNLTKRGNTRRTRRRSGKLATSTTDRPVRKKSRLSFWVTQLGAIAALLSAGSLIVGGAYLALQLMVDPDAIIWINRFLPEWTRIPVAAKESQQTLEQIQTEITEKGLTTAEPLLLNDSGITSEILLPVMAQRLNCQTSCQQIVELRVYQKRINSQNYQLVNQITVSGPEESAVNIASDDEQFVDPSSSRILPLTEISPLDSKVPDTGIWLYLTGKLQGETPVFYGQILHYNPTYMHLSVAMSWKSASAQLPYWQQITGDKLPELVVNQTVGLEPRFLVYQIKSRDFAPDPIQLEDISLSEQVSENKSYRHAMMLASNGLWSTAEKLLKSLPAKELPPVAKAQMALIRLHAQITESQSKRTWSSPSQQVLSQLIDGRWPDALQVFQSVENAQRLEIANTLKNDSGRLLRRVEAALKVTPSDGNVEAWGAMIVAAQQGRPRAIAWLQERHQQEGKKSPSLYPIPAQIEELLTKLTASLSDGTAASNTNSHSSQIIGSAQSLTQINSADWLPLNQNSNNKSSSLQLEDRQVWYQVQVVTFHDGRRWLQSPFSEFQSLKAEALWNLLGLDTDPQIQIAIWGADGQQQLATATVKGLQIKDGQLRLLAAAENSPDPGTRDNTDNLHPLAYTGPALQWVTPGTMTLTDLNQLQPEWGKYILKSLWRELQKSGQKPSGAVPSIEAIQQSIGHWSVQTVTLKGNGQSDAVLTLYQEVSGALSQSSSITGIPSANLPQKVRQRSLIFSETGNLLYSELTGDKKRSLVAIADLSDGGVPALVIYESNNYKLLRWSNQQKRFE